MILAENQRDKHINTQVAGEWSLSTMHSLSSVYLVMGIMNMLTCYPLFLPGKTTLCTSLIYILTINSLLICYMSILFRL